MVSGAIHEKATTDTRIAREVAAIHETAQVNAQLAHNAFAHDILYCKEWRFSRRGMRVAPGSRLVLVSDLLGDEADLRSAAATHFARGGEVIVLHVLSRAELALDPALALVEDPERRGTVLPVRMRCGTGPKRTSAAATRARAASSADGR